MHVLRIEAAELRVLRLPLKFRFETSFGVQSERVLPLLTLHSGGLTGIAEGVMDAGEPVFKEETVEGALQILRLALLPGVLGKSFSNPAELSFALDGFRGNPMAKAMLEMAFWDLWARSLSVPLKDPAGWREKRDSGWSQSGDSTRSACAPKNRLESRGRGVQAHQTENQTRLGRERGRCRARGVPRYRADGGCEQRLYPW
jgi:L-alanine-DL-glutamate epimerase-like enolase superfamily enzyme